MSVEDLTRQEDALRDEIGDLPPNQRKQYYELEKQAIRDPDTYAVLNYFFVCGLHHFYLGKTRYGLLNVFFMLVGLFFWEFYGWVLVVLVFVVELPQLFRSQRIVQQYNLNVMRETLEEIRSEH